MDSDINLVSRQVFFIRYSLLEMLLRLDCTMITDPQEIESITGDFCDFDEMANGMNMVLLDIA